MLNKGDGIEAEFVFVIGDGDMVAVHACYIGFGPKPYIALDVFRLEDGKIAEHWDVIVPMPGRDAKHNETGKF